MASKTRKLLVPCRKSIMLNWFDGSFRSLFGLGIVLIGLGLSCEPTTVYDEFVLVVTSQENVVGLRIIAVTNDGANRAVYDSEGDSLVADKLSNLSGYDLVNGKFDVGIATGLPTEQNVKLLVYGYKDTVTRKPTVAFADVVQLGTTGPRSAYLRSIGTDCDQDADGALSCGIPGCCVGTSYDIAVKDCDDINASVSPFVTAAPECIPCNAPDYVCSGKAPVCKDDDNDGVADCSLEDCDSNDPDVHAGHAEVCDFKDNDCDGDIDEGYDVGTPCTGGTGTCKNVGTTVCAPDSFDVVCSVSGVDKGIPCDDGNLCTNNDVCTGGINSTCRGSVKVCDDLLECTTDSCANGDCVAEILPNSCVIDKQCYETGDTTSQCLVCDPDADNTSWSHVENGTQCDDGDECTTEDVCVDGVCVGGSADTCDDGLECTLDLCDSESGCSHVPNDELCDDNNVCTDNQCSIPGGCIFPNKTGGCDDNSVCTEEDTCTGGLCTGTPIDCDDDVFCTIDSCIADSGCQHQPSDALCDDMNPCTTDVCIANVGCDHTPTNDPCNDKNSCTTGDFCSGGVCQSGAPIACDDNNQCTTDSCDPAKGCVNTKVAKSCDDGNACTSGDTCVDGVCKSTKIIDCADGNICTTDSCDPSVGCKNEANTLPCQDGNACTDGDTCKDKVCAAGGPTVCDDGNQCTSDTCFPATGCSFSNVSKDCDDGNPCTLSDKCIGGVCVAGPPKNCNDNDECTTDTCDVTDGSCVNTPVPGPGCP